MGLSAQGTLLARPDLGDLHPGDPPPPAGQTAPEESEVWAHCLPPASETALGALSGGI